MAVPDWTAEREVGPGRAAELVAAVAPALAGAAVVPLATGWDNTVLRVDDAVGGSWAFRFPRRAVALPGVRREIAVLPRIAPLLPLPVPVPEVVGSDGDPEEAWPFTGARLLPGQELAGSGLAEEARVPAAAATGDFLRVLHSAEVRAAVDVELPVDPLGRGTPASRLAQTRAVLAELVGTGVWGGDPGVDAVLDRAAELDAPRGVPVLVHGDLHARHLLVDPAGRATGVLDWGDLCLADPALDLSLGFAAFSGAARAAFLAAYGPVDAERELRARALAVRLAALLARYAVAVHAPALLAESLASLRRAVR
jgi:aminoglycoside phosphotransferase (APT) family kinase protein